MSELLNARNGRNDLRWRLLTTVSALTLIGSVSATSDAKADDTDRPTLWIELGGQLEQQTGQGDAFVPSFVTAYPDSLALKPGSPLHAEKAPLFSNGLDGKITFEPEDTNWVFSASIRYGRSVGHKTFRQSHTLTHIGHATFPTLGPGPNGSATPTYGVYIKHRDIHQNETEFAAAQIAQRQSHTIVDFSAGKDVGLGMFGKGGASDFNIGVRFAQFVSKASGAMQAQPDAKFLEHCITYVSYYFHRRFPAADELCFAGSAHHTSAITFQSRHNFHGIGPALSWNASVPVLGQAATLNVDWGANASILFGRQRASGSHHTYVYYLVHITSGTRTHHTNDGSFDRSKTVVVPNFGGFAGLSFNFTNAKVALGYRGDFFFGAMDTGNDTRKTKTVGFYGPFASISVGIGG